MLLECGERSCRIIVHLIVLATAAHPYGSLWDSTTYNLPSNLQLLDFSVVQAGLDAAAATTSENIPQCTNLRISLL